MVAMVIVQKGSNPDAAIVTTRASELNGIIVAARKEARNRPE